MRRFVCRSGSSTRLALVATSLVLVAGCFKTPQTSFPPEDDAGAGDASTGGAGGGIGGSRAGSGGAGGSNRPCEICSGVGACQMPADDPACGTIACPQDTTCRDYATAISSNRCKSLGECKTAADCAYSNAPAKQVCGFVQGMTEIVQPACDGAGNCVGPKVKCGGDGDCSPFDNMNCCGAVGSGLRCQATACTANQGPFWCDEKADCAPGYVCCSFLVPTPAVGSKCMLPENCVSSGPSNYNQVCNPGANPSECSTGSCQLGDGQVAPPGFYICK